MEFSIKENALKASITDKQESQISIWLTTIRINNLKMSQVPLERPNKKTHFNSGKSAQKNFNEYTTPNYVRPSVCTLPI